MIERYIDLSPTPDAEEGGAGERRLEEMIDLGAALLDLTEHAEPGAGEYPDGVAKEVTERPSSSTSVQEPSTPGVGEWKGNFAIRNNHGNADTNNIPPSHRAMLKQTNQ